MENEILLSKLAEKIRDCTLCPLYKGTKLAVPGEGNPESKIFFIGEAPGFYEDQTGRPFVGRAGQLLDSTLVKVGLTRAEVFIGNVVKHRPPENRDPLPPEINACKGWLDQQLSIIKPTIVVTLGRFSMNRFLPGAKISLVHGQASRVGSQIVLPMYHPAAALRSGEMLAAFEADFIKNKDLLLNPKLDLGLDNQEEDSSDQIKLFN